MTHDVFISASAQDKQASDSVCTTLEARGIHCWIAPRDLAPGAEWAESIIDAIESARCMVLVFSGHADASPQVRREVERAVNRGIPIVPLRIEDVQPTKAMLYFLSAPQWLDAFALPLEHHITRLADAVQLLLDKETSRKKPALATPASALQPTPPAPNEQEASGVAAAPETTRSGTETGSVSVALEPPAATHREPAIPSTAERVGVEGERRQITVLFADLVGFTAFSERSGEEAAYHLMQRITVLLREPIEAQGGTVANFTGDGVMALFGVPRALEDAPLRACRAALLIQEGLAAQGAEIEARHGIRPQLRVGINAGPAVLARVDNSEHASVTALGDTVNLASRLQALAEPGAILLSEAVQRLVENVVRSRFLGEHQIKGKAESQRVYRLDAVREMTTRFDAAVSRGLTVYIGRDHELEILERAFVGISAGPRVIDVSGEPGIGKSRLVHEFRQRLGKGRAFILSGTCSVDGQQTPFLPFIEIVRNSFRVAVGEAEKEVARKLGDGLKVLGLASTQNVGLLLNLLGLNAREKALKGLDGTQIGLRTRDLLQELFPARCRLSSVVMFLEDLHWIDRASEELMGKIIDSDDRVPLMIVYTRRPEYRPPWFEQPKVSHVALEPLSDSETAHIVQARLHIDKLPGELARLIADKAEGNPLFAEEIASFLLERGIVRLSAGELQFNAAAAVSALPASVQSLLSSRIDRLSPADRALLQAASVIGRRFDSSMLAAVTETGSDVEARLAALQGFDLIYSDRSGDYFFKHSLVRDALYDGLLTARRAALHLKVAQEVERKSGNRLFEVAEALAHHYAAAARTEKAFFYLSLAGKKSADILSLDEAEQYFRRALSLHDANSTCADDAGMAATVAQLLDVLFLKAEFTETVSVASRYMARLEAMGNTPELVRALVNQAISFFHCRCDFRACEALCRRALSIAEQTGDLRARAYALIGLRIAEIVQGSVSIDVATRIGADLMALSRSTNDNFVLNWAYLSIGWDYLSRGLLNDARDWAWQLIDSGRDRNDRRAIGMAHWILAYIDLWAGRYDEFISNADECLQSSVAPFDRTAGAAIRAAAVVLNGDIGEGLTQILELRRWMVANGWLYLYRATSSAHGAGLVLAGRIGEGMRVLMNTVKECDREGDQTNAAWNRIVLAEIYIEILTSQQTPGFYVVLRNFGTILQSKLFGARRARTLLERAALHEQLHEQGALRARINMDLGLLYKFKQRPVLARQFLEKARAPTQLQGAAFMVTKIDDALAELR